MATIVTSKIGLVGGPTRDYTSIQAWEDACPANLVTVDQVWKGVGYNDGELTATAVTTISGTTTDATRYLWLTAAPGQSFSDNPAKATNRLAYVAANGVALRVTTAYSTVLDVLTPYTRVDSWQFQCSAANSYGVHLVVGANFAKIANCIMQSRDGPPLRMSNASNTATNCLAIANSAVGRGVYLESGAGLYNCTVVRPSNITATGDAIYSVYGTAPVKNCAFFGFATLTGVFSTDGHNVTSSTVVPGSTGSLANKVYANQFVQSSTAGGVEDFRVKAGADLIGAGAQDTANTADLDIIGQARSTTAPTVGAWEFANTGPTPISGTFAATEAADILAAAGSLGLAPITGTFARTEGADTLVASGTAAFAAITGTLARTEGSDTLAASGTAAFTGITGTLASTEAPDTATGAGTVTWNAITGLFAATENADSLSASGTAALPPITGTFAATEAPDTLAGGNIPVSQGMGMFGGAGSSRGARDFADHLDRADKKATKAQKKARKRAIEVEALELLPDLPQAEQIAPVIAQIVYQKTAPSFANWTPVKAMQPLPPAAYDLLRAQVDAWLQHIALMEEISDEHDVELLLLG